MRPVCPAILAIIASAACPLLAAEIQLRARCQARGPVVTLGDLAEVLAADPQQAEPLARIELFPAPVPGQQRIVRARELQDLLSARQIDLAEHRLSGSSQVVVESRGETQPAPNTAVSSSVRKRAERLAAEAIARFLRQAVPGGTSWNVELSLSDAQARAIPADGRKIAVRGGEPPWTGSQSFELAVETPEGPSRLVVRAEVSARQPLVVAAVALARGAVVRETDVQVVQASAVTDAPDAAHALDDVVGKEAVRAIPAGAVVQSSMLRSPLVIRRGEIITVYARSAGIRVRTTARAREDGGLGDLISVELLSDRRKVYSARVSGIQEAEVFARAVQSGGK
jgi:flagella basal body P-ring formation protein FlgA